MAINFPNNPSNGAQHTASGITWTYDGTTWKADGVTNSYVLPTASATVLGGIKVGSGLTINAGVLATTGGGGSQTLDQVLANGNTTTRDIDTTGKILFSNNYAQSGDLPSASTYHGMFAHVHAEGHGYFAHAGAWTQLLDTGSSIGELTDVNLSSAPTNGQVLKWDSANNYWAPANDNTGGGGGGSQTLDDVLALNNVTTRDIDTTGKILFSNNYATTGDLPSASTYHGMFAHVHGEGHGYYAHAGAWVQLLDTASSIGELTDVDLSTSPTSGQVLKWNGSKWAAAADSTGGGGGSLTIQDEGNALSVAATTLNFVGAGVVASGTSSTKTITIGAAVTAPPTISWTLTAPNSDHYVISGDGFVTGQSDPDLYLIRGQTYKFVNNAGSHPFRIQSTVAQAGGGTQYNDGVTNNDAGNGTTLTFVVPMNAPDTLYYQCTNHTDMFGTINILSQGSGSGLGARTTVSSTTGSIANNAQDVITFTGYRSYVLLSVKPSVASWVTIYTDGASRTADTNRVQGADPAPDAGVIAEVITTSAASEVKMTPGVIGWNNDNPPSTQIYAKVVNLSGSTAAVNVELKLLKLEA